MTPPPDDDAIVCSHCSGTLTGTEPSCPHCGEPLMEGLRCRHHPHREARGACVLCGELCCISCGSAVHGMFVCNGDQQYEIMEEMANVYGVTDNVQAQYVCDCLTKSGLHPFLYSRSFCPPPGLAGNFAFPLVYGRTLCEMKVFVPFAEVIRALDILDEIEVIES